MKEFVDRKWLLGWSDISSATNVRSFIPSVMPKGGAGHTFLVALTTPSSAAIMLHVLMSSLAFDYVSRQKLSGLHLMFHLVKQLACPTPTDFEHSICLPAGTSTFEWFVARTRELSFTSWRMVPFARDLGDDGPPFRWIPERREQIRAEVDAMMFHVYGLDRDEVDYVMDTFTVLRKYDVRDHGEFRTKRLILEFYDLLAEAIASSVPYESPISPPPGFGPRHDESTRPSWMKEEQ